MLTKQFDSIYGLPMTYVWTTWHKNMNSRSSTIRQSYKMTRMHATLRWRHTLIVRDMTLQMIAVCWQLVLIHRLITYVTAWIWKYRCDITFKWWLLNPLRVTVADRKWSRRYWNQMIASCRRSVSRDFPIRGRCFIFPLCWLWVRRRKNMECWNCKCIVLALWDIPEPACQCTQNTHFQRFSACFAMTVSHW